ncbi:MAG: class I SAM-dependent methyltransferase [Betaproteobacteria bacterium]|nr:class I SAM-dependent methyltransferase [Betaproteobacteria bacterium]
MKKPFSSKRRSTFAAALAVGTAAALSSASARAQRRNPLERPPLGNSPEERRVLAVLDEVYRTQRYLSVPETDGRLLRMLVESIGAKHVVEIGTSTGYSGLWLLTALMKTGGRLTTYEIDRGRHDAARANFERAGVLKLATLVLGDAHAEVAKLKDVVDLAFIDADKEGYLDYLRKLSPLVRPGGLIVAHNMASPPPDPRYVDAVTANAAYDTIFLNMHDAGVGVTLKKR